MARTPTPGVYLRALGLTYVPSPSEVPCPTCENDGSNCPDCAGTGFVPGGEEDEEDEEAGHFEL